MIIKLFWFIHVDNFHVGYYSLIHFPLCWRYQNISQHQYHRWLHVYAENPDQHAHVDSDPLDFIYKLDNLELERVSTEKDVGVNITNSLTWNTHIHAITAKANKLLGLLKRTCPLLNDVSARRSLYLALVKSQLSYATQVWSPDKIALKTQIERVQRRATRWILKQRVGVMSYRDRLLTLKLLPLTFDRELKDLVFFLQMSEWLYWS